MARGRRRDAILAAARSEFARFGFAGARIERIADAADVNKQLIFHYFQSKDGLHSAAVSADFAGWLPVPDASVTPSEHLYAVIAHLVQWLIENPGAARAIVEAERASWHQADSTAPAVRWLVDAKGAVRSAVESGQRQGHFRDDVEPQAVAEVITSSAVGYAITAGVKGDTPSAGVRNLIINLSRAMIDYCSWH